MSNDKKMTPEQQIRAMGTVFEMIANQAEVASASFKKVMEDSTDGSDYAVLSLINVIGCLADKGAKDAGCGQMRGDVEWFLPPSYDWAIEEINKNQQPS